MADIVDTLAERGARYGDFTTHANLVEAVLDVWTDAPGWARLSPDKRQTLRMLADKTARILNGDPEYRDNWHDIAGYAKLAEDRCVPAGDGRPASVDSDGWIEWHGGNCPVPLETRVAVRLRDPVVPDHQAPHRADRLADTWCWKHWNNGGDITHYRILP